MHVRVARWNLERPGKTQLDRPRKILDLVQKVDAEARLWILTETNEIVVPGMTTTAVASTPVDGLHRSGENWTTIWSRFPVTGVIPTHASEIAKCVDINSPIGSLVVLGTVSAVSRRPRLASNGYRGWQSRSESIPRHGADWRKIRQDYPSHIICVAGDFNPSWDETRWHPTAGAEHIHHHQCQGSGSFPARVTRRFCPPFVGSFCDGGHHGPPGVYLPSSRAGSCVPTRRTRPLASSPLIECPRSGDRDEGPRPQGCHE